jgi:uncharacterized Ntn-hydrolase superfamily protein
VTFSIVACDNDTREWGVAVASKFLSVGAAVPYAEPEVGAVATQAFANLSFGPRGLEMLRSGASATEVVDSLISSDDKGETRQLGVVDAQGRAAAFTGEECFDWAGDLSGPSFTCQGNILTGSDVVERMKSAYEGSSGELARRLLAALKAGDDGGGDKRGRQAAAVLVVRKNGGYGGESDVTADLRVDDHPTPVDELARIMDLHRLYFPRPEDLEFVSLDAQVAQEVRALLEGAGYSSEGTGFNKSLRDALFAYMGTENLEERWSDDEVIERQVLDYLRSNARS